MVLDPKTAPLKPDESLRAAFRDAIRPPERLTVTQWSDRYRFLTSKSAGEGGQYRSSRTPFVVAIQDALSWSHPCRRVTWQKGSQLGGTEILVNWVGYTIDHDPCAMMVVEPSLDLAKRLSRQRIDPMIQASPRVREKVADRKTRDAANSMFSKEFDGGMLLLTGANSAASLRQAPIKNLALDEVDAYPVDVEEEGDPVQLAIARCRTHPRAKIYDVSSPTDEISSRIAREFREGDQSYYHIPCPDCGHFQRLVWENIRYEKDAAGAANLASVRMACVECGSLIPEHKKTWMLENGKWVATHPERSDEHRSFQLSSLYSPNGWFSWKDAVKLWEQAQGNRELLKVFVNTVLGETWKHVGDSPVWQTLYNRRENYPFGCVPPGGIVLVCGVDVQKDRLEYEVVAFGRQMESWSVDYGVILGEPSKAETWRDLERAIERPFPVLGAHNQALRIRLTAIDSGYSTNDVYNWVRVQPHGTTIAVKGIDNFPLPIGQPQRVDVLTNGKTLKSGMKAWPVGTAVIKRQLYGWLRLPQPTKPELTGYPPGWCHFPQYDEEKFEQLCAEICRPVRNKRGYTVWQWEKIRARNEFLDCRVYARAAASLVGLDRYTDDDWNELQSIELGAPSAPQQRAGHVEDPDVDSFWGRHG